jgi:ABC-type uncharacterized transport system permease subunit
MTVTLLIISILMGLVATIAAGYTVVEGVSWRDTPLTTVSIVVALAGVSLAASSIHMLGGAL